MTNDDEPRPGSGSSLLRAPYSVELLADLHADVLDGELAAQLWPLARADPDASRVLAALDATVAQLHVHAQLGPAVPPPAAVDARIAAALAQQQAFHRPATAVTSFAVAKARRAGRSNRATTYAGAVALVAAAAAAVFALTTGLGPQQVTGTPQAAAPSTPAPSVARAPLDLGPGTPGPQALAALGRRELGPLSDKATLAGCLQANGLSPSAQIIGASPVTLDGKPGVLLLLPTTQAAVFTALVVGPDCSAQTPATRSRVEIGAR